MPHATETNGAAAPRVSFPQDQDDDNLISQLINNERGEVLESDMFDHSVEFDQRGKADDAVDYGDLDDDDLADEEDVPGMNGAHVNGDGAYTANEPVDAEVEVGYEDDPGDALDDLFGDSGTAEGEQPLAAENAKAEGAQMSHEHLPRLQIPSASGLQLPGAPLPQEEPSYRAASYGIDQLSEEQDAEVRQQLLLFAEAEARRAGTLPPAPPEDRDDFLQTLFPDYDPKEPVLYYRLLPPKKAFYASKNVPQKPPKPILPTKVNLELCQDQEKTFTLTHSTSTWRPDPAVAEQNGLVVCSRPEDDEDGNDVDLEFDQFDENEQIGGLTMDDITMLCTDWDIDAASESSEGASSKRSSPSMTEVLPDSAEWEMPPHKRQKTDEGQPRNYLPVMYETFPSLDDPEATTAYLSRRVPLDLNDPHLLIVEQQEDAVTKPTRPGHAFRKDVSGSLTKSMNRKYNISNDEAYDRLKDNHSHKIRSTIGNLTVEHGLPALKLQFPFYKVKLNPREARSFHRPTLTFKPNMVIRPTKRGARKRKDVRPLPIKEAYERTSQLTFNDNSDISLFEYSEEYPMMMSNFAMGSKLVNYYRRKDEDDNQRPRYEWGDTQVLLPQDKSPFSIFGNIEPGEHQPTLHNSMFRAPVWKHENKSTDFIIGCDKTGQHGQDWFFRNLQNTYVVGQQFPSVEVPGTHARKVTEAAKRRLKMISWRIWRRHAMNPRGTPKLTNDIIKEHLPGTDVPQNRSKMREFMNYDKETQTWNPSASDPIPPDLASIRALLRPEDVCLLDAMQVGHRHLLDAGYNKDDPGAEENDDEDMDKDGESLEQQLAPWQLTKNFLNACQSKAMLELHGPGDPSGRGEAFSFVKTSMKGGFKAVGESIEDRLDAKRQKELGGHSYNVARQQRAYEDAIKRIWEAQKNGLAADAEHSDIEPDIDDTPDDAGDPYAVGRTPRSEMGTPGPYALSRREEDSASAFSRYSANSQHGKVLRITRVQKDRYGKEEKPVEEVINDPKIIRAYLKRRKALELANITDYEVTGDPDVDAMKKKAAEKELARLNRNKDRRHAREKAKGKLVTAGDGEGDEAGRVVGTQRKCANCGQVGHIKTNKKLCPLLNGTQRADNPFDDSAFGASVAATPRNGENVAANTAGGDANRPAAPAFSP